MFLYNTGIYFYYIFIRIAALFNAKAAKWLSGRAGWANSLKAKMAALDGRPIAWVHCASLGEFEQGRPIIEAIKKQYPQYAILLSFFSPSGYEVRKDYDLADIVCYLPLDSESNAAQFINIVQPQIALFIKYEFWLNYLRILKQHNTDTYIASAVFKQHQPFFKWYGGIFRRSLQTYKTLFVQDEASKQMLASIGINNVVVCGDTRFDRVIAIRDHFAAVQEMEEFKGNSRLIVAGSTWPKDEDLVLEAFQNLKGQNIKLVIAPHDIKEDLLAQTGRKLEQYKLGYCRYTSGIDNSSRVLVLDTVGLLSRAYHYADIAYIGGGFNGGLHNCLEAAVYGIPVTFADPNYKKYNEAEALVQMGAAENVLTEGELHNAWQQYLDDRALLKTVQDKTAGYFLQNANATEKIMDHIRF